MAINDTQQQQDTSSHGSSVGILPNTSITGDRHHHTEPNAGSGDPTDGREQYEWTTCYPRQAVMEIRMESVYLFFILFSCHFLIFAIWKGWINSIFSVPPDQGITLKKYAYYAASGMLGGVVFGIKYFYRVVARGYWHQDRRIWRIMSPFLAMTVALIVGAMINATLLATQVPISGAAFISIGFLAGYFADQAIAKMYEIARVIFGTTTITKAQDGK